MDIMSLLDEARIEEAAEAAAEEVSAAAPDIEESTPGIRISMPDLSFLAAPTGEGPIEEYMQHPLNFDNKKSTARILRGCTGICGNLDYAIIDIALGVIEKIKEKGNSENADRPQEQPHLY